MPAPAARRLASPHRPACSVASTAAQWRTPAGGTELFEYVNTANPLDVTDVYQEQVVPDATAPAGLSALYKGQKVPLFPVLQTFRINNPGNGTPDDLEALVDRTEWLRREIGIRSIVPRLRRILEERSR